MPLKRLNITFLIFLISYFTAILNVNAQQYSIKIGKNNIALNEYFTIKVAVKNEQIQNYSQFPEISGFAKRGTSSSSSTNIINGRISSEFSITQNYQAQKEGTYSFKPFEMKINGKLTNSRGGTINVGPAIKQQRQRQSFWDPFNSPGNNQVKEFVDIEDDAFFAISTDKKEIYVGEGVHITMGFYVSETNRAQMNFYEIGEQVPEILKNIKPKNCWEENFEIKEIAPETIILGKKRYTRYKLYEGTFYPLSVGEIKIPQQGFKMIKYKEAKQKSFFGQNHKEDFKTFYSQAKTIKVKELPPHPLKDLVSVGNYRLTEGINKDSFATGESFNYQFQISGEGNISGISKLELDNNSNLQIYPPNEFSDINRSNGRVSGKKVFEYYIIPNEPGEIDLSETFNWIFFNPSKGVYDTLTSNTKLKVVGNSQKNATIESTDLGSFYDKINYESNDLVDLEGDENLYLILKILAIALLIGSIFMYFRNK